MRWCKTQASSGLEIHFLWEMDAYILEVQWLPLILPPTPTLNALAFFSIDTSVSRISSYKKFSDHSLPQYSLSNFILSLAQLLWWVPRSWILINLCMRRLPAQSMCMVLKGRTMSSLISISFQMHNFVLCVQVCEAYWLSWWRNCCGISDLWKGEQGEKKKNKSRIDGLVIITKLYFICIVS